MHSETDDAATAAGGTRTAKVVVFVLGVLIASAGLAATFWPRDVRELQWSVVSVDLSREGQATVTFDVEKAPLATVECQASAFREGVEPDGKKSWRLDGIVIGPRDDGARVTRRTVVVPVEGKATRASVANCVVTRDH